MRIFVGNMAFVATEEDVRKLFEGFGTVASVLIATEKKKAKPRGFCFVEMPDDTQAAAAIAALNGTIFMERPIDVIIGREKPAPKPSTDYEYEKHNKPNGGAGRDQGYQRRSPYRAPARAHVSRPRDNDGEAGRTNEPERKSYTRPSSGHGDRPKSAPFKRTRGGPRPAWAKDRDQGRPWKKPDGQSRPWRKPEEGASSHVRAGGESRPWRKPGKRTSSSERAGGESRPWKKSAGEAKPWQKRSTGAKPWQKSGARPHRSSFKGAKSPYRHKSSE